MSHSAFYRKVKSLTGCTAAEFIRKVKLRKSRQLLEQGGHTVSEVAQLTGFNNLGNFRQAFKKEFGMPPQPPIRRKRGNFEFCGLENLFCGLHLPILLREKINFAAWKKYFSSRTFLIARSIVQGSSRTLSLSFSLPISSASSASGKMNGCILFSAHPFFFVFG